MTEAPSWDALQGEAAALRAVAQAGARMCAADPAVPGPRGVAARELREERAYVGLADATRPLVRLYSDVVLVFYSASEHVSAFTELVARRAVYADKTVARGALEACAQTVRLADPTLTARRRLGRWFSDLLEYQTSYVKFLRSVGARSEADRIAMEIPEQVAKAERLLTRLPGNHRPPVFEDQRQSRTTLVETLFGLPRSDSADGLAGAYNLLSGFGHAQFRSLGAILPDSGTTNDDKGRLYTAGALGIVAEAYSLAAHAFEALLDRDRSRWNVAAVRYEHVRVGSRASSPVTLP